MKTKLLLIIPTLDRSGAEKQCVLLASHLPKAEFDVHVAVLTRTGPLAAELEKAGIPYTVIGKSWKIDPVAYFKLKRLIRRLQPDIVHTWLFAANAYGRRAALACRVPRIVADERCVDPWKSEIHLRIDRYLARKTHGILTNSRGVVDFYTKHGIPADQFTVIPNAVLLPEMPVSGRSAKKSDDVRIDPRFEEKPEIADDPYIPVVVRDFVPPEKPFLIGIVARLWPQKRIGEMLWVFESLKFTGMNFHALILGDGPERDLLLRLRDMRTLSDCVHFLGHRSDVARFLVHFDLLLCPSGYEGQSNAILEAMAHGIPVIASDIPGNDELVVPLETPDWKESHGDASDDSLDDLPDAPRQPTGVLVPECGDDFRRRRSLFVKEILKLYEQDDLRRSLGEAARQRVRDEFTLENMIDRHVAFYRQPAGNHD